ncbi:ankyrin repeat domain-containing protein [Ascidiimonas sp. W6]|uniref:ankyrin repeat domain-containing protein n=1 Tax=Ascidiimonas meishanensis TaxID=3128903 RepID=UPI0030EDE1D7
MEEEKKDSTFNTKEDQLVYACSQGYYLEVQELLASGVSPNCQGLLKTTPLNAAATHRQFRIIDLLLTNGADINFESDEVLSFSRTPLAIACNNADLEMVEYLLERGADIDLMSGIYGNPIHAAIKSNSLTLLAFLIEKGAWLEAKHGVYLETPICAAARLNHLEAVALLIAKGAKTKPLRKMPRKDISGKMVKFLKARGCI